MHPREQGRRLKVPPAPFEEYDMKLTTNQV